MSVCVSESGVCVCVPREVLSCCLGSSCDTPVTPPVPTAPPVPPQRSLELRIKRERAEMLARKRQQEQEQEAKAAGQGEDGDAPALAEAEGEGEGNGRGPDAEDDDDEALPGVADAAALSQINVDSGSSTGACGRRCCVCTSSPPPLTRECGCAGRRKMRPVGHGLPSTAATGGPESAAAAGSGQRNRKGKALSFAEYMRLRRGGGQQ